jgi:mono/diheme cytochrome c family protein
MIRIIYFLLISTLYSCGVGGDNTGIEYAPQMYHGVAYYPLSQVKDKESGKWLSSRSDNLGEFYNSNDNNPHSMNMRIPPKNTVKKTNYIKIFRDASIEESKLKNPYNDSVLSEGALLYGVFCSHCHGENGKGDGLVGQVYKGVPAYNKGRVKNLSEGHIFHVITHGYGRMGAHGSQMEPHERWKIVKYVQKLQQDK